MGWSLQGTGLPPVTMALNKIRDDGSQSFVTTIPVDDLKLLGLIDKNGDLSSEQHVHIQMVEPGEWRVSLVENS